MSPEDLIDLEYDWKFWARKNQLTPQDPWITWLIMAGRGFGKTRTGAETIKQWEKEGYRRFALMAKTPGEARDVMIQGESGLLAIYPPDKAPIYEPSKRRITWPSGAIATIYSGENFEQSRGGQAEKAWIDELAKYKYPQDALDNIMFGLRLGNNPQVIITTTPKPIPTIKELIKDSDCITTRGTTYDNIGNLANAFIKTVVKKYEGTRLGRQELYADVLDDNPNSLWTRESIEIKRLKNGDKLPNFIRVVVAIDPAVTVGDESDDTGIIVAAVDKMGDGYLLEDKTGQYTPNEWATMAASLFYKYNADRVVGEANNGGDMIEFILRTVDRNIPYTKVYATRGKLLRAEPIAGLYEQGRMHHVGYFGDLEDQMCEWQPGDKSPNNLDAMVWAFTELFIKDSIDPVTIYV